MKYRVLNIIISLNVQKFRKQTSLLYSVFNRSHTTDAQLSRQMSHMQHRQNDGTHSAQEVPLRCSLHHFDLSALVALFSINCLLVYTAFFQLLLFLFLGFTPLFKFFFEIIETYLELRSVYYILKNLILLSFHIFLIPRHYFGNVHFHIDKYGPGLWWREKYEFINLQKLKHSISKLCPKVKNNLIVKFLSSIIKHQFFKIYPVSKWNSILHFLDCLLNCYYFLSSESTSVLF